MKRLMITIGIVVAIPLFCMLCVIASKLSNLFIWENRSPFGSSQAGTEWVSDDGKLHLFAGDDASSLEGTLTVDGKVYEVELFAASTSANTVLLMAKKPDDKRGAYLFTVYGDSVYPTLSTCKITVSGFEPVKLGVETVSESGYKKGDVIWLRKVE